MLLFLQTLQIKAPCLGWPVDVLRWWVVVDFSWAEQGGKLCEWKACRSCDAFLKLKRERLERSVDENRSLMSYELLFNTRLATSNASTLQHINTSTSSTQQHTDPAPSCQTLKIQLQVSLGFLICRKNRFSRSNWDFSLESAAKTCRWNSKAISGSRVTENARGWYRTWNLCWCVDIGVKCVDVLRVDVLVIVLLRWFGGVQICVSYCGVDVHLTKVSAVFIDCKYPLASEIKFDLGNFWAAIQK